MPTGTFFRLPEEKRMRLMESAWEEFTHISYADVSINKIIQAAGIPRGSFYQYFDGKEDLFFYLDVYKRQVGTAPPAPAPTGEYRPASIRPARYGR